MMSMTANAATPIVVMSPDMPEGGNFPARMASSAIRYRTYPMRARTAPKVTVPMPASAK